MGQKGTGRRLSDQERMEIIAKLEGDKPRASAAECARQYGVSSAAITKLMKMKDKIKQRFKENNAFSQQRKRGGTERHAAFEDELYQWIKQEQHARVAAFAAAAAPPSSSSSTTDGVEATAPTAATPVASTADGTSSSSTPAPANVEAAASTPALVAAPAFVPLTSAQIQEKAQELLKAHDLGTFRASKGWYYRFCRRYGLSRVSLGGQDAKAGDQGEHADDVLGPSDWETDDGSHEGVKRESRSQRSGDDGAPGDVKPPPRKKRPAESRRTTRGASGNAGSSSGAVAPTSSVDKSHEPVGWAGVDALQDTLARAAMALDHPQAREYLGDDAATEMLRSIQQSIGVVQCIRLKKCVADANSNSSSSSSSAHATNAPGIEADPAPSINATDDVTTATTATTATMVATAAETTAGVETLEAVVV